MGYILPITPYQYQEYHNRVNRKKADYYYIERPYKSVLESTYQDFSLRNVKQGWSQLETDRNVAQSHDDNQEVMHPDITGKGYHVNAIV